MPTYFPKRIEPKWQQYWLQNKTFRTPDFDPKPKYYILDMFPYPSGDGLHVGHPEGYTATDILARFKRMRGFNVLHPMGWDAFGLPAEQYAVEHNIPPSEITAQRVDNFRRQIQMLGFSYDWDREINTTDPGYYRWTQWIFLQLFNTWYDPESKRGRPIAELPIPNDIRRQAEANPDAGIIEAYQDGKRLAYRAEVPVNWCPYLGTVLANEEVVNGRSERGNHPVVRMPLRQWMLRITSYAERLLDDLDTVEWPHAIKEMQRNWIGKSEGAEVDFLILQPGPAAAAQIDQWIAERADKGLPEKPDDRVIRVYTTRPDTLFGASYMVLAPEHPLVDKITTAEQLAEVNRYREQAAKKSDMDRTELSKEKTGVFTGAFAVNPADGEPIPVWIADYVLMGYGTGAIMAVPAHDERDFEFALKHGLDIIEVVADPEDTPNIMLEVHRWLGEWERREDRSAEGKYLKAAILLNCGFDMENFEKDLAESKADPIWAEVKWFFDPEEGQALAIAYLEDDFADFLVEYVEESEDTQILVFSLDPAGGEDMDELEPDDEDEGEDEPEVGEEEEGHVHGPGCGHEHEEFDKAYTREGICVNSGLITGLPTAEAKATMSQWLEQRGLGKPTVNYKLRDWLFSRQRYWGEPFPIIHDANGRPHALSADELPVSLPELSDFKPTGTPEAPLSKAGDWLVVQRDGKTFRRETNTMPQWAGSCWYFLRYLDPNNDKEGWSKEKEQYWMPVDLYVGGAEHAVLHLLYSRFWHKVLFDLGHVHTAEPFNKLINQGMILGKTEYVGYKVGETWISPEDVVENDEGRRTRKSTGEEVTAVAIEDDQVVKEGTNWVLAAQKDVRVDARAFKMSKSRGNVINPDDVVGDFGADALRMYEMFMGPLEATKPWSTKGVEGIWRFLNRAWRAIIDERAEELKLLDVVTDAEPTRDQLRTLHQTIRGVTEDIDAMRFNTAISKLMEYVNFLTPLETRPKALLEPFVLLLSPFAPHAAEELWFALGHMQTLAYEAWPSYDEVLCAVDVIEVAVQINNKLRSKIEAAPDLADDALIALAREDQKVRELLDGKQVIKAFVVGSRKGKLVNFVVKG